MRNEAGLYIHVNPEIMSYLLTRVAGIEPALHRLKAAAFPELPNAEIVISNTTSTPNVYPNTIVSTLQDMIAHLGKL